MDTTWFPFDHQHCFMKFGSWAHDGDSLDLRFGEDGGVDLSTFTPSGEWILRSNFFFAFLLCSSSLLKCVISCPKFRLYRKKRFVQIRLLWSCLRGRHVLSSFGSSDYVLHIQHVDTLRSHLFSYGACVCFATWFRWKNHIGHHNFVVDDCVFSSIVRNDAFYFGISIDDWYKNKKAHSFFSKKKLINLPFFDFRRNLLYVHHVDGWLFRSDDSDGVEFASSWTRSNSNACLGKLCFFFNFKAFVRKIAWLTFESSVKWLSVSFSFSKFA